jgi:hypothetical protein
VREVSSLPHAIGHFDMAAVEARAGQARRVVLRLWLPLTPVLLLLAPLPVLAIPLLYLLPGPRVNWAAAVFILGDLLLALGGTDVLVDARQAHVRLKIL